MKIGIHLSTFTERWDEDVLQYLPVAKEIGYDGVEFPILNPFEIDSGKIESLLQKYDLQCTCGTGLSEDTNISSLDEATRERGIAHLKKCVDRCAELGSPLLGGVLYAPWGEKRPRRTAQENIQNSAASLKKVAEYAEKRNVSLALEILNRYESYFINTVSEGLEFLKNVGHANVGLHFDTFHAHIEERDLYQALVEGGRQIRHIHFCENTRGIPGTGQIPWNKVKAGMEEIGYDDWIVLENFVMPDCQVGETVSIWRPIEKSGREAAIKGYKAIREIL